MSSNVKRHSEVCKFIESHVFLDILQVFRVEALLTVYRPLDIQELFEQPMGGKGQRLSGLGNLGN